MRELDQVQTTAKKGIRWPAPISGLPGDRMSCAERGRTVGRVVARTELVRLNVYACTSIMVYLSPPGAVRE